jgi:hypothetical protein
MSGSEHPGRRRYRRGQILGACASVQLAEPPGDAGRRRRPRTDERAARPASAVASRDAQRRHGPSAIGRARAGRSGGASAPVRTRGGRGRRLHRLAPRLRRLGRLAGDRVASVPGCVPSLEDRRGRWQPARCSRRATSSGRRDDSSAASRTGSRAAPRSARARRRDPSAHRSAHRSRLRAPRVAAAEPARALGHAPEARARAGAIARRVRDLTVPSGHSSARDLRLRQVLGVAEQDHPALVLGQLRDAVRRPTGPAPRATTSPGSVAASAMSSRGISGSRCPARAAIEVTRRADRVRERPRGHRHAAGRSRGGGDPSSHVSREPERASNWRARRHSVTNASWTTPRPASRSPRKRADRPNTNRRAGRRRSRRRSPHRGDPRDESCVVESVESCRSMPTVVHSGRWSPAAASLSTPRRWPLSSPCQPSPGLA